MKIKTKKKTFLNITYYYYIIKKFFIYILLLNILHFENCNNFLKKRIHKISLVVPIIPRDFHKIFYNIKYYIKYIDGIKNIIFIGNEKINDLIKERKCSLNFPISFINENLLIDANKIKQLK